MFLVADWLLALAGRRRLFAPVDIWLALILSGVLFVALTALVLAGISTASVRDAVPYLYGALVFITPSLRGNSAKYGEKLIGVALFAHLLWTSISLADPRVAELVTSPGNEAVGIFMLRSDIDGLVNGIAACIGLYRLMTGRRGLLFFAWGATLVLVGHSRIAFLVLLLNMLCTVGYVLAQRRRGWGTGSASGMASGKGHQTRPLRGGSMKAVFAVLCVGVCAGILIAPTSIDRLAGTFGGGDSIAGRSQAEGTTKARLAAWSTLIHWINDSPERSLTGNGFGTNIMTASGAGFALVQSEDPDLRSPHNFLLGVWAHLGLIGSVLVACLVVYGLILAARLRRLPMSEVDLLAALLVIGIPLLSSVGVVFESPFGAIPYFWALGQIGSSPIRCRL
jgi:hypothetical protein